jgi:hypothetical protein
VDKADKPTNLSAKMSRLVLKPQLTKKESAVKLWSRYLQGQNCSQAILRHMEFIPMEQKVWWG